MGFTDFFCKEMMTNLIFFLQGILFHWICYLKQALLRLKIMNFYNFFLCGQPYRFRDISQTSELKSIIASTWFIHFDRLCNYLHSFQKQPATNFIKNNCCFAVQERAGDYINKPDLMRILLPRSYILLSLVGVVVVAIVVVVAELVVVAVVVVIVLVAVVVLKYWPGQVNRNGGP